VASQVREMASTSSPRLRPILENGSGEGVTAARQLLQQAEQVRDQWHTLTVQEAARSQDLSRLQKDLPADRDNVRREHGRLEADEKSLEKSLTAKRLELREVEEELERLTREREQAQTAVSKFDGDLKQQEFVRNEAQKVLTRTRSLLPPAWQAAAEKVGTSDLFSWKGEQRRLEEARTDERGRQLQEARLNRDVLRKNRDELAGQAEAFPAEARQEPSALASRLSEARTKDRAVRRSCAGRTARRTSWTTTAMNATKSRRSVVKPTAS